MSESPIGITVLGSTGSIGMSTLDVIAKHPENYNVIALTAHKQVDRIAQQCHRFEPEYAVMLDENCATQLQQRLRKEGIATQVLQGVDGLEMVSALPQIAYVMAAIVGAAGLKPTLAAARSGKRILLANKESLVMSGQLFIDEVKQHGAELLPIDSEHNAIFQCMPGDFDKGLSSVGVQRILLTASGGPFREWSLDKLQDVTPEQACAHPNWSMGQKISVDSATMMNKGLEVIEACWLFNTEPDAIQVVIHPQSIIHSMVEYNDGSVLAQMGNPDMRTPIAHALAWPERISSGVKSLNLFDVARLDFEPPDMQRFPCLRLSIDAMKLGGTSTTILNAANEIAVESFLQGEINFLDIATVIETTLEQVTMHTADNLDQVLIDDNEARMVASNNVAALASKSRSYHS